jgi:hypothetical protein
MTPTLHASRSKLHAARSARRGQVLVESLVALSVLTTGFLGMLTLLARSIGLNRVVADNYAATYLAAEGVEVIKNLLDYDVLQRQPWGRGVCDQPTGAYELTYATTLKLGETPIRIGGLSAVSANPLLFDGLRYQYAAGTPTPFKRTVLVSCAADVVTVNSVVNWMTRGNANFQVNIEDHFTNWRP